MKTRIAVMLLTLMAIGISPLFAAVPCAPSSPWPPAAGPIVKAVPWVVPQAPICLITPHDTISGATIYLKATTANNGSSTPYQYYWDFGDGSPATAWANVSDPYSIGVTHVYTGPDNTPFTATVYVKDNASPANINSAKYFVMIRPTSLAVQANIAIDQGLWRMHRELNRYGSGATMYGYWNSGNYTSGGYPANYAANTTAFLVNGHKPDVDPQNPDPYAETALRGLNGTLYGLASTGIPNSVTNPHGTFDPDENANGIATYVYPDGQPIYETGMVMDMLVATGLPSFVAQVGGSGIIGQTLKDILQDMMDYYTYCQNTSGWPTGGWRYGCRTNESDNSTCQWAAIGILAATDPRAGFNLHYPAPIDAYWNSGTTFGAGAVVAYGASYYQSLLPGNVGQQPDTSPSWWAVWPPQWNALTTYAPGGVVTYAGSYYQSLAGGNTGNPPNLSPASWAAYTFQSAPYQSPVIAANKDWLAYDYDGYGFGYTSPGYYPWGPWAVTPSGMVQMVMDQSVRGTPGSPTMWDNVENWVRGNFSGPLNYWYGLFSFTKSMLLYPGGALTQICGRDGFPSNNLTNCIDWYNADTSKGDPIDGVAKTLVSTQYPDGFWWGYESDCGPQCYFDTAWATIMLNRTVYQAGLPVAVIDSSASQVINGGVVNLTGRNSFHQDPTKQIVLWEWDLSGTGSGPFSASGVNQNGVAIQHSGPYPFSFPVRLRVTDNSTPTPLTAIATAVITITAPPFNPTANAGGPYGVCPQAAYLPFYLNGAASFAPGHLPNTSNPDNQITKWEWDLNGVGVYSVSGATLSQPRVDDFYASEGWLGSGSNILVGLRITDNSQASFGLASNLQGTATAQVYLRSATDQICTKCVSTGQAIPHGAVPGKAGYIALVWLESGAHHYNIYRGTVNGGPYTLIGTVPNTVLGTGKSLGYSDGGPLTLGVTYYYRIAPATLADVETCQSNQASASGSLPRGR